MRKVSSMGSFSAELGPQRCPPAETNESNKIYVAYSLVVVTAITVVALFLVVFVPYYCAKYGKMWAASALIPAVLGMLFRVWTRLLARFHDEAVRLASKRPKGTKGKLIAIDQNPRSAANPPEGFWYEPGA
jgi:hypothetical protein